MINYGSAFLKQVANEYGTAARAAFAAWRKELESEPSDEDIAAFRAAYVESHGPYPYATLDETQETCVRTTERVVDNLMPHLTSVKRILRKAVRGNHARACHRTVDQKPQCCSGPDCDTSSLSFWGPMEDVGNVFAVG